jgi:beta-lactam-binding protein with PASTA domain
VTQPSPPEPPDDAWPVSEEATAVASRETVVQAPAPEPAGPPPDRRIGAGMLLGLAAVALVAAGAVIAYFLTQRDDNKTTTVIVTSAPAGGAAATKVSVPRLIGLKEQAALVRLSELGLRPKEVFKPTNKANGLVVDQKPKEATELAKGGQVTLVIDSGAPQIAVPDLTGQSFATAQSKLDAAGLDSTRTEVSSDQPAGTVVDQAPKGGAKVAKGSTVTLSVAKQRSSTTGTSATTTSATTTSSTATSVSGASTPTSATVPDVSGQTEQAAATAMADAGVLASLVFVPSQDPLGTVEQQAKPSGTTVPYHSHVQINISKGPGTKPDVTVPDTIGQSLTQAVATLNGAKLRLIYVKLPVTSRAQAGKVVQQSPLAGGHAPQNAQILVYLGAFKSG